MTNAEQEHWSKLFDLQMGKLEAAYDKKFSPAAVRVYFDGFRGWSEYKLKEAVRKAIESERFCPTVATIRAYGGGVHEPNEVGRAPEVKITPYTPEQVAELEKWKKDFAASFRPPPWMGEFQTKGRRAR